MERQSDRTKDEPDDENDPDLNHQERHHAGSGPTPPAARIIHEIIREEGETEIARSLKALSWSAFGAGLSMGFSFFTMGIIKSGLPEAPWAKLVTGFGYTIGFLIVVLGRQQLFTESTLTAVLPVLTRKDGKTFYRMARLWAVVFFFNVIGTFLFGWLLSHTGLFDSEVNKAFHTLSEEALKDPFWPMTIKAVLAGWLIALMVWLIPGAGQARLFLIIIITYVVAIAHFSHIIAGSVEASFAVFTGIIGFGEYFTRFMLPTLLGNVIGGVSLVAILNHAPVRNEIPGGDEEEEA